MSKEHAVNILPDHVKVSLPENVKDVFADWSPASVSINQRFDAWPGLTVALAPADKGTVTPCNTESFRNTLMNIEEVILNQDMDSPGLVNVEVTNPEDDKQKLFFKGFIDGTSVRLDTRSLNAQFNVSYAYSRLELMNMSIYQDLSEFYLDALNTQTENQGVPEIYFGNIDRKVDPENRYPHSISIFLANILHKFFEVIQNDKMWDYALLLEYRSDNKVAARLANYSQHQLNLLLLKELVKILATSGGFTILPFLRLDDDEELQKKLILAMLNGRANPFATVKMLMKQCFFHMVCPLTVKDGIPYFRLQNYHEDRFEPTVVQTSRLQGSRYPPLGIKVNQVVVYHPHHNSDYFLSKVMTASGISLPVLEWSNILDLSNKATGDEVYGAYPATIGTASFRDGKIHVKPAPGWVPKPETDADPLVPEYWDDVEGWYSTTAAFLPETIRTSLRAYLDARGTSWANIANTWGTYKAVYKEYAKGRISTILDWIAKMQFLGMWYQGSTIGSLDVATDLTFTPGFRRKINGTSSDGGPRHLFSGYVTNFSTNIAVTTTGVTFNCTAKFDFVRYPILFKPEERAQKDEEIKKIPEEEHVVKKEVLAVEDALLLNNRSGGSSGQEPITATLPLY
jgi:hypothetical protein